MTRVMHPNRRRKAASALVRALVRWHGAATQGQVLALRHEWPRWPRISPDRTPPRGGGFAHVG